MLQKEGEIQGSTEREECAYAPEKGGTETYRTTRRSCIVWLIYKNTPKCMSIRIYFIHILSYNSSQMHKELFKNGCYNVEM